MLIKKLVTFTLFLVISNLSLASLPNISSHYDGKIFFNDNKKQKGFVDFLKWRWERNPEKWPEFVNQKSFPAPRDKILKNDVIAVTLVGHSTFLIQTSGYNILTDPVWSKNLGPLSLGPKRVTLPGISLQDLPKIDIILISHNHYDHLDVPTIDKINKRDNPLIITPLNIMKNNLSKLTGIELDWWGEKVINNNLKIILTPALHWSKRGLFDTNLTLWSGFIISTKAGNIYFSGDTGFGDGKIFKEIKHRYKNIKLSLLPIGAYLPRWFMAPIHTSPEEAVEIFKILKSEFAAGMHYNTFNLADDGYNQGVRDLKIALQKNNISSKRFRVLEFGSTWYVK